MGALTHSGTLEIPAKMHRYGRWGGSGETQKQRDFQEKVYLPETRGPRRIAENADFPGKTQLAMVLTP